MTVFWFVAMVLLLGILEGENSWIDRISEALDLPGKLPTFPRSVAVISGFVAVFVGLLVAMIGGFLLGVEGLKLIFM